MNLALNAQMPFAYSGRSGRDDFEAYHSNIAMKSLSRQQFAGG